MRLYQIHRTQVLPLTREEAWNYFSSPHNLPVITPPWLDLRVIGDVPERMFPGMVIHFRLTPLSGIQFNWITEITHVEPQKAFVDEQRFGPYRFWHHHHLFRPKGDGIEMTDRVAYCLKYGPVGELLHTLFIRKKLKEIFDFRERSLARLF